MVFFRCFLVCFLHPPSGPSTRWKLWPIAPRRATRPSPSTSAFGGGWQRIVRHEALKLGLGVGVVVLLHCLRFQSPSAPSCHARAASKTYEDFCVTQSVGQKSCLSLFGGSICTWR